MSWRSYIPVVVTLLAATRISGLNPPSVSAAAGPAQPEVAYGARLPASDERVSLWTADSGWKIGRAWDTPRSRTEHLNISAARNEAEATQLVVRPTIALNRFTVSAADLIGPNGSRIPAEQIDILSVVYLNVTVPTDSSAAIGFWPDALPPAAAPLDLVANQNHPFWIRINVPRAVEAGTYAGSLQLEAAGYQATVPLVVAVYDFTLPDRMTCTTAFGFSPGNVFRYQGLTNEAERRAVLELYWKNFGAHHISPYDPAPLDPVKVTWPDVKPPVPLDEEEGHQAHENQARQLTPAEAAELQPQLDFSAWQTALTRAIDEYHFNTFRLSVPGLGGGTFHGVRQPQLLGFDEDSPEYEVLFNSYVSQLATFLRGHDWTDEAFVYWFDEPSPTQYAFVKRGFEKLKRVAPDIHRMLTEQVEPELIGGPNIWCPISNQYDQEQAEGRRGHDEKFWWYICTGPKAPYATLFIDHPGTELRVWLWQTYQRGIDGVLVWQSNYWTSGAAYPQQPQNPYQDPMGWRSGYSTPAGEKHAWGNGDGRFIYPPLACQQPSENSVLKGPVDSIRWEMLRDGIEDYEYHVMLRQLIAENQNHLSEAEQEDLRKLLIVPKSITTDMTHFTTDPAPIAQQRERLARAIESLGQFTVEHGKRVLIVTGEDYPGHKWKLTTPVLKKQIEKDQRLTVDVLDDLTKLASARLVDYETVVMHFKNYDPQVPGRAGFENLKEYVEGGGGLVLVHFACGAFQEFKSDFEKLAGRAWNPKLRGHDPFGKFRVDMVAVDHPVTRGMKAFETTDELYTCLDGDTPITALATAVSQVDGKTYPMAFVLTRGKGRVFHCVLGHDVRALENDGAGNLFRRGTSWAAGLDLETRK